MFQSLAARGWKRALKSNNMNIRAFSSSSTEEALIIPIELVSDTLWPNGYIGKKHLNKAIQQVLSSPLPDAPKPISVSILRVPYFLEPHYDENKPAIETNRQRLIKKWGGKAGWEDQKRRHDLKGRGIEAGIPHFNLDRKTSNTMSSHRLIQFVGKKYGLRVSELLYDRLNVYYFVEGHALNDRPRLANVAHEELVKALSSSSDDDILSEEDILKFLNGNEGRREIEHALQALNNMGVHGIPKFIIEGRVMVDGAARSDVFVNIFREIERNGSVYGGPIFGEILGVDPDIVNRGSHHVCDVSS
jgi:predicted DsbA family dithiol-disulfide isomerase